MNLQVERNSTFWVTASYWLAWLALVASLLYTLASYGNGRLNREYITDSDAAYIPAFIQDVITHGTMSGWNLPPNPYFFPDMALFAPLALIVRNINITYGLYGIAQLLLAAIGMVLMQRYLFSKKFGKSRLAQTFMLFALTLTILFIATGKHLFHLNALTGGYHFGVLVVIPLATLALLAVLQAKGGIARSRQDALILFVLIFATSLSDSLFTIQFVFPALVATWLWAKGRPFAWRRTLWVNIGILVSAAAGQWFRQLIVPVGTLLLYTKNLNREAIALAFSGFLQQFKDIAAIDPWLGIFWLTSLLALSGVLVIGLMRLRHQNQAREPLLVAGLFFASIVVSPIAAIASGNAFAARYILPTIFLPLMAGWPLFLASWRSTPTSHIVLECPVHSWRLVGSAFSLLSLLLIGYIFLTSQRSAFAALVNYQDPLVVCLERETAQRQIRNGLAEYWQTTSINVLSEGRLHLVTANRDLSPYLWIGNRDAYREPIQFTIIHQDARPEWLIQEETLFQKFGPPKEIFECETSKVYVYDYHTNAPIRHWFASSPKLAELNQVGDVAEFFGYALPSGNGGVSIGLSMGVSEDWGNHEGTLAYADLQTLPAGSYSLALDLYTDSANIGSWEVVDKNDDSPTLLATGPIETVGKSAISGHFILEQQANVELRVQYNGHGTLFVDRLRIAHVEPTQAPLLDFADLSDPSVASAQPSLNLLHPYTGAFIEKPHRRFCLAMDRRTVARRADL